MKYFCPMYLSDISILFCSYQTEVPFEILIIEVRISDVLTLSVWCISENCIEIKIKLNFFFILLCRASNSFMNSFKASIKPSEASQRSVKIKDQINFLSSFRDWDGKS